ncbi:MAG: hypothetical protein IIX31_04780, partial [Alistipes sp.]|nr:hypothetical protein [Alistipes sp.]
DQFTKKTNKIKNAAGTMVGHVINSEANDTHGIEFINSGKPVFLYSVAEGAQIVVYYDNLDEVVLK